MSSGLNEWLDRQIPVGIDDICSSVVARFRGEPAVGVLPVRGPGGVIVALLDREHFLGSFAGRYAWSLLSGRPLRMWFSVRGGCQAPQVIRLQASADEAAGMLARLSTSTTALVVEDETSTYVGLVHERALLTGMLEELASARDQAVAASEAKTVFLGMMSHELRTPFNGIIGISDLLLLDDLNVKQRELAVLVRNSGEHLLDLLTQILDYASVNAGRLQLREKPFALALPLGEVSALVADEAQRKGLRVRVTVASDVPGTVVGDQSRLLQVLIHLIGNAVKFSESGEVLVGVTRLADGRVNFTVVDSGPGIDEPTLSRLFSPFVQSDDSSTRRHGGSGMGLATSQRLVELMGGRIEVSTKPGHGSSFSFALKLQAI